VPDSGESIKLPREALPAGVYGGSQLDSSEWVKLCSLAEYHVMLDRALRVLGRREHFVRELERKLRRHSQDRELVARVIAECLRLKYLDDERAAAYTTQQLLLRGGIGLARLRQELLKRGCPTELARLAVAKYGAELDESAEIKRLLRARRRSWESRALRLRAKLAAKELPPARLTYELKRQLAVAAQNFLKGRGFSGEAARNAVGEMIVDLLELESR
jgi:regulatory protein